MNTKTTAQMRAAIAAMRVAALANLPSRFGSLRSELASGLAVRS